MNLKRFVFADLNPLLPKGQAFRLRLAIRARTDCHPENVTWPVDDDSSVAGARANRRRSKDLLQFMQ